MARNANEEERQVGGKGGDVGLNRDDVLRLADNCRHECSVYEQLVCVFKNEELSPELEAGET